MLISSEIGRKSFRKVELYTWGMTFREQSNRAVRGRRRAPLLTAVFAQPFARRRTDVLRGVASFAMS